jgi:hypothetical protein
MAEATRVMALLSKVYINFKNCAFYNKFAMEIRISASTERDLSVCNI